jgi:hypothetical protein
MPKDANHLGKGILAQTAELVVYDKEEQLPDTDIVQLQPEVVMEVDEADEAEEVEEETWDAGDQNKKLSRIKKQ